MKIGEMLPNYAATSKHFCLFKSKTIANIRSFCNHFNFSSYVLHSLLYQWHITSPFSVCHIWVACSYFVYHHYYVPSRAVFFWWQCAWTVVTATWHGVWFSIIKSIGITSDSENICTVVRCVIRILEYNFLACLCVPEDWTYSNTAVKTSNLATCRSSRFFGILCSVIGRVLKCDASNYALREHILFIILRGHIKI
jgi:hypothetical protein